MIEILCPHQSLALSHSGEKSAWLPTVPVMANAQEKTLSDILAGRFLSDSGNMSKIEGLNLYYFNWVV